MAEFFEVTGTVMRNLTAARLADLEAIAKYFETQAWDESWPFNIIFALARTQYPDRAPFVVVVDGGLYTEEQIENGDTDDLEVDDMDMFYMTDVRDKDGKKLVEG